MSLRTNYDRKNQSSNLSTRVTKKFFAGMTIALILTVVCSCSLVFPTVVVYTTNDLSVAVDEIYFIDQGGSTAGSAGNRLLPGETIAIEVPKGVYTIAFMTEDLQWQESEVVDMTNLEIVEISLRDSE